MEPSGGAGIFSKTGSILFNQVICMDGQIKQFAKVRNSITQILGSKKASDDLLKKSIYIISIGSNDLIEYAMFHGGQVGDQEQLIYNLTTAYGRHIKNLYALGARKFGIIGVPPLGCCPASRGYNATSGCYEVLNDNSVSVYSTMKTILNYFSLFYDGFMYSLGNTYALTMNVIDNPHRDRFKEVITACCGSGRFNGQGDCIVGANLCSKRDDFLFWDKFHSTEKASELAAQTLVYGEGNEFVTPMNFSRLAMA